MSLEIFIGPMFSSKSSLLIRRYNQFSKINKRILVLTSNIDTRYLNSNGSKKYVVSHDHISIDAQGVDKLMDIIETKQYSETDVILIEEAQFFTDLTVFIRRALQDSKKISVYGLSGDYKQEKFGQILDCIPMANDVTFLKALCSICQDGTAAEFTKRVVCSDNYIEVGTNNYVPTCRKHFEN